MKKPECWKTIFSSVKISRKEIDWINNTNLCDGRFGQFCWSRGCCRDWGAEFEKITNYSATKIKVYPSFCSIKFKTSLSTRRMCLVFSGIGGGWIDWAGGCGEGVFWEVGDLDKVWKLEKKLTIVHKPFNLPFEWTAPIPRNSSFLPLLPWLSFLPMAPLSSPWWVKSWALPLVVRLFEGVWEVEVERGWLVRE